MNGNGKTRAFRLAGAFAVLLMMLHAGTALAAGSEDVVDVVRERTELDFAGFVSAGELTYPARGDGPFPTVILIAGSGVADMDHTVVSPFEFGPTGPRVLSQNFRAIADHLSREGYAVLRYNKRHVLGPNQADYARFYQLSLYDFLADAHTALEWAREHPKVDPDRIVLYGWSEGSSIAAALAAERDDVAGLVLQTPVVYPWRETFMYQVFEVGFPYVLEFVEEGRITDSSIAQGLQGDGGMVAKMAFSYLVDASFMQTGAAAVNGMLDDDKDGALRLGTELTMTRLASIVDSAFGPGGYLAMYAPSAALPTVGDLIGSLDVPILILQGGADANVPPQGAEALAQGLKRLGGDVTLYVYPKLGHSLGEAGTPRQDNFQPIAERPLDDVAQWLKGRF